MSKSAKWILAICALLFLVLAGFSIIVFLVGTLVGPDTEIVTYGTGEGVAVIEITGTIYSSSEISRQLKEYRKDDMIKAILLRVESPGGSAVASEEIYEDVRKTRDESKPVVVSVGSMAASGGYYVACGATRIVANRGSLVGGIGAIAEFLQVEDAMEKLGVNVKVVKTGRLKDAGSPVRRMTSTDERYFQSLLDEIHLQFVTVVRKERGLDSGKVAQLSDGRVFTGEQGVQEGLVDTLGTLDDAVRIAGILGGIEGEPALVKERKHRSWWDSLLGETVKDITHLKDELMNPSLISFRFVGPMWQQ